MKYASYQQCILVPNWKLIPCNLYNMIVVIQRDGAGIWAFLYDFFLFV